ncbi:MAG: G8 domain-containing protein [Planctomycetaceae bacterium]
MLTFSRMSMHARNLLGRPNKARRKNWTLPRVEPLEVRLVMSAGHTNSAMTAEHLSVFGTHDDVTHVITGGLVPDAAVNNYSVVSGEWDDPATWSDGVPDDDDNVVISHDTVVTIDSDVSVSLTDSRVALRTVRVDGELEFDPHANTKLLVDTIVVMSSGVFEMGTEAEPIDSTHRARLILADRTIGLSPAEQADFDHDQLHWDPLQFSHGLLSHGAVSIHGSHVTSFVSGQKTNLAGSTTFDLGVPVPSDWKVGDQLIISGTTATNAANVNTDDQVKIAAISGNVITLATPLKYSHFKNTSYVADVNRNATFESETPGVIAKRGHIMFMHSDHVHVDAAGFYGLGRTDKRTVIDDVVLSDDPDDPGHKTTDVLLANINPSDPTLGHRVLVPVVDANGNTVIDPATNLPKLQIAKTGLNQRGRYAVHFHRTGTHYEDEPATINDSVVVDSPGWGIVNHSSYVNVTDNVVFNAVGAAFVTEAGDEIGSFDHNLAMHSQGSGANILARQGVHDFGHQGDGFWLQGGNVSLTNNVATGQRHAGFVFFPRGLDQKGLGVTTISGENLEPHYAWANPATNYEVADIPLLKFQGNSSFGVISGYESWFTLLKATHSSRSVIEDFHVSHATGNAIEIPYTNNTTFKNVTLIGNLAKPNYVGIERNSVTQNIVYDHVNVQGFAVGINAPQQGVNTIVGGTFNNLKNINIETSSDKTRVVNINDASPADPVVFINNLTSIVNGVATPAKQFDIYMNANFQPLFNDLTKLFNPDVVQIGLVAHNGQQVYFYEQAADFTPFPSIANANKSLFGPKAAAYVPAELLNKTNAQLFQQYGLAVGGVVAPANSVPDPLINGIVGPKSQYQPELYLFSPRYYNFVTNGPYKLTYGYAATANSPSAYIAESLPTPLVNGWNLLTRTVLGQPRTLLVFGDSTPPNLQLDAKMPTTINKADLDNGSNFLINAQLLDNSIGSQKFQQTIKLNDPKIVSALKTKADGTQFVTLTFTIQDLANNKTTIKLDLNVTFTAPLLKDIGRKNDPFFVSSPTLLGLIG